MTWNPYRILGVDASVGEADLVRAYRRQAQRWHPDRNPTDPQAAQRFQDIQAAYRLLKDPALRRDWDRRQQDEAPSSSFRQAGAATRKTGWRPSWAWSSSAPLNPLPGDHAHVDVKVPLASVFGPQVVEVTYRVAQTCPTCNGQGGPACPECMGTGQRFVPAHAKVRLPAGVHDGQVLRVKGLGHAGPRFTTRGDLWVRVRWTQRGIWRWQHDRLVGRLGWWGTFRHRAGPKKLRAPDGAWGTVALPALPAGGWVRLAGLGLPRAGGQRDAAWIQVR